VSKGSAEASKVAAAAAAMLMVGKRVQLKTSARTAAEPIGGSNEDGIVMMEQLGGATVTVLGVGACKGAGYLDLVLDDGRCVRDEPQASVATSEPRTPKGTPGPVVLQRSFTAVTTKKRPVTEGGYEFERPKEAMVDASHLMPRRPHRSNKHSSGLVKKQLTMMGSGSDGAFAEDDEDGEEGGELSSSSSNSSKAGVENKCHPKLILKLRLRQQKMGRVCPKGHPLQAFQTPNPSYSCDAPGCGKRVAQGTPMHGCRECNFDFCTACVRAFAGGGAGSGGSGAGSASKKARAAEEGTDKTEKEEESTSQTGEKVKKSAREIPAATPLFQALHELMIEYSTAAGGAKNVVQNLVSVSDSYDLNCTGNEFQPKKYPALLTVSFFFYRCG
jgi:hypothetical protein